MDVAELLSKVGIEADGKTETAGVCGGGGGGGGGKVGTLLCVHALCLCPSTPRLLACTRLPEP